MSNLHDCCSDLSSTCGKMRCYYLPRLASFLILKQKLLRA
jgi:hypothetical protein